MGASTLHIFISVLCDNLLLTVVVPILPELLRVNDLAGKSYHYQPYSGSSFAGKNLSDHYQVPHNDSFRTLSGGEEAGHAQEDYAKTSEIARDCLRRLFHLHMLHENSQLGLLFSTKAFVQLFANPLVGRLTFKVGYKIPLCIGNFILFLCSLVFAFANSYALFVVGRSFHGLASSLISVSGMALVAKAHPKDEERTKFLGRVMGASALGVLLGYPFGGITFSMFGKFIPFMGIAILAGTNVVYQITQIHKYDIINAFHHSDEQTQLLEEGKVMARPTTLLSLFKDRSIKIISVAICLSTTAMAVLEPTLPVWLIENMNPPKWQLGLVFVPDSLGYFVGTNFFGEISLRFGRWKMSMISLSTLGVSCFILPMAKKVWQLSLPHFTLGLGLGIVRIVDSALQPLLATLADKYHAGYGAVYALAQTSVALAYSLGPLVGGELVPVIGFPDLIRSIGFLNLLFCPFMFLLSHEDFRMVEHVELIASTTTSSDDEDCERDRCNLNLISANSGPPFTSTNGSNSGNKKCKRPTQIPMVGNVFPLKSYDTRYVQSNDAFNYQRFNDQLDSD